VAQPLRIEPQFLRLAHLLRSQNNASSATVEPSASPKQQYRFSHTQGPVLDLP
jgi:hypothetical protein